MRAPLLLCLVACASRATSPPLPPAAREDAAHHLVVLEPGELHASGVARAPFECAELVPSWNVRASEPFLVEVSVAGPDERWSPWLLVGAFGLDAGELDALRGSLAARTSCERGRVDVDTFVGSRAFDRARLRLAAPGDEPLSAEVVLERAAFAFTAATERARAVADEGGPLALEVEFRSQRSESDELAPRACSPTALAMVLAFHGVELPTASVAARVWDPLHDIYGNWSRAIQVAAEAGLAGHVARFSDWAAVRAELAAGRPLVASVRALPGELPGAPVAYEEGHLIVVTGFDASGDVLVNDPACALESEGRTSYTRAALERVWFQRRHGTAYVIEPARRAAQRRTPRRSRRGASMVARAGSQ